MNEAEKNGMDENSGTSLPASQDAANQVSTDDGNVQSVELEASAKETPDEQRMLELTPPPDVESQLRR